MSTILCFEMFECRGGIYSLLCVLILFVSRWRWCGDGRGSCGACRAWYQWVVHWHVWKDGHLPARGTDRSEHPSHFAIHSLTVRNHNCIVGLIPSINFKSLTVSFWHAFTSTNRSNRPAQAHVRIIACWKTWTNSPAWSTWRWKTSASTLAGTCRISTINVSEICRLHENQALLWLAF